MSLARWALRDAQKATREALIKAIESHVEASVAYHLEMERSDWQERIEESVTEQAERLVVRYVSIDGDDEAKADIMRELGIAATRAAKAMVRDAVSTERKKKR